MAERSPMPHVIVVLPGIMGSTLQKDGKNVWGISAAAILKALLSGGQALDVVTLVQDLVGEDELGDKHLPGKFTLTPGRSYFELPYDWRRDIRVAARKLDRHAAKWLPEWRISSGNQQAKLILIAHSMGGLVARYTSSARRAGNPPT